VGLDIHDCSDAVAARLKRVGIAPKLAKGSSERIPFPDNSFDAILMAFTLELFDTPEIPQVIKETIRVLKPGGRIAVVSLSKEGKASTAMRLYEWAHRKWPRYADCRPIYVERSIADCGYVVASRRRSRMAGLPLDTVLATKPGSTALR